MTNARAFGDAIDTLIAAAKRLSEDERDARQTTAHHLHRLEQVEVHLRGVVSGKFDGKEIAEFLLNEYFKQSTKPIQP